MADKQPLLDLSTTEPERPFIRIDGEDYNLAVPEDFGLRDLVALQKAGTELETAFAAGAGDAMDRVLDDVTHRILSVPAEVYARLRDMQKLAIVRAFSVAAEKKNGREPRQNGESSSPASSGSTEAESVSGSTSPPASSAAT